MASSGTRSHSGKTEYSLPETRLRSKPNSGLKELLDDKGNKVSTVPRLGIQEGVNRKFSDQLDMQSRTGNSFYTKWQFRTWLYKTETNSPVPLGYYSWSSLVIASYDENKDIGLYLT